jgi:opacity protein-like surface antigen
MRKVLAVLAVLVLGAASASAGGLGVFGSYIDTEDPGTAYGGGLKFKFDVGEMLAVELRGSYITGFEPDDEFEDLLKDMILVPIEADLVINLPMGDAATIYVGGGGGYYVIPEFEIDIAIPGSDEPDVDPDDEFGFFALAGIELNMGESVALFAEAQYRFLEDDEDVEFGDDGVVLDGIGANVGLMFKW